MNEPKIVLTVRKRPSVRRDLIGTVKITEEAEVALRNLSDQTGLSMRQIASSLITQAAEIVEIEEI